MKSDAIRWLLGLRDLPQDSTGLRLTWERPLPEWGWMLVVLLCVLLAIWSYQRLDASRGLRALLGGVRGLLLLLVAVLLAGPMLELPRVQVEPDWVAVLVDRSRSMGVRDGNLDSVQDERVTREEVLQSMLADAGEAWRTPGDNRRLLWVGFGDGAMELEAGEAGEPPVALGEAEGWRTRLAPALEEVLRRTAGRPLSGVVVVSDGRTEAPPDRDLVRRLLGAAAQVHAVPLGSRIPIGDAQVARIESPRRAFSRDAVPVSVQLESRGREGSMEVSLVDVESGEVLDRKTVEMGAEEDAREVVLTAPPSDAGNRRWSVLINSGDEDLVPENDRIEFELELVDRPLRVLFMEGYPRWEYRYLKNLLVREPTIESSVMLLSADQDFAQEGNAPIARLPRSAEEFSEFDLIILGDVPAGFLTERQQELIREQVARRGGGLLFIGGSRSLPSSWSGRPLADLLPFTGPLDLERIDGAVMMQPTDTARRLGVLRLVLGDEIGWPAALSDPTFGWSALQWAQRIEVDRLKPTAEVLAEAVGVEDEDRTPLVIGMRYGAGQVLYVGTDEVWRWRYGRGEQIPEQFWVQLLRLLGREAVEGDTALRMSVEPDRTEMNRPVRISVDLFATTAVPDLPETVRVDALDLEGNTVAELELASTGPSNWGGTWVPEQTGTHVLRLIEPSLAVLDADTEAQVEVLRPDAELRLADADHELLESLAEATGGDVHEPSAFNDIVLPNRSFTTERPLAERIWTSPLAFMLLVLLATLEWTGRRLVRLD
ncbi:MAG: hypothetical protein MK085_01465 [Phycisphaerales bacterium]|nr:hypothetical protein [Phycisphaerales bacterium]